MPVAPTPSWQIVLPDGRRYLLPEGVVLSVGREVGNDIHLPDPAVSRRHSSLTATADGVLVDDHHSTAGTFVNERQVDLPVLVTPLDTLRFGPSLVRLETSWPVPPPVPAAGGRTQRPRMKQRDRAVILAAAIGGVLAIAAAAIGAYVGLGGGLGETAHVQITPSSGTSPMRASFAAEGFRSGEALRVTYKGNFREEEQPLFPTDPVVDGKGRYATAELTLVTNEVQDTLVVKAQGLRSGRTASTTVTILPEEVTLVASTGKDYSGETDGILLRVTGVARYSNAVITVDLEVINNSSDTVIADRRFFQAVDEEGVEYRGGLGKLGPIRSTWVDGELQPGAQRVGTVLLDQAVSDDRETMTIKYIDFLHDRTVSVSNVRLPAP